MNDNDIVFYEVVTQPDFDASVARFINKKRFRSLPGQISEVVLELEQGRFSGDKLFHSDEPPYDVYKKRLPNPDASAGKSNGYRVIYLAEHARRIVALLAIYYKKEQESVTERYITGLIDGLLADFEE